MQSTITDEVRKQTSQAVLDTAAAIKVQQVSVIEGRMACVRRLALFLLLAGVFVVLLLTFLPDILSSLQEWPQMKQFKEGDIVEIDVGGTDTIKVEYS